MAVDRPPECLSLSEALKPGYRLPHPCVPPDPGSWKQLSLTSLICLEHVFSPFPLLTRPLRQYPCLPFPPSPDADGNGCRFPHTLEDTPVVRGGEQASRPEERRSSLPQGRDWAGEPRPGGGGDRMWERRREENREAAGGDRGERHFEERRQGERRPVERPGGRDRFEERPEERAEDREGPEGRGRTEERLGGGGGRHRDDEQRQGGRGRDLSEEQASEGRGQVGERRPIAAQPPPSPLSAGEEVRQAAAYDEKRGKGAGRRDDYADDDDSGVRAGHGQRQEDVPEREREREREDVPERERERPAPQSSFYDDDDRRSKGSYGSRGIPLEEPASAAAATAPRRRRLPGPGMAEPVGAGLDPERYGAGPEGGAAERPPRPVAAAVAEPVERKTTSQLGRRASRNLDGLDAPPDGGGGSQLGRRTLSRDLSPDVPHDSGGRRHYGAAAGAEENEEAGSRREARRPPAADGGGERVAPPEEQRRDERERPLPSAYADDGRAGRSWEGGSAGRGDDVGRERELQRRPAPTAGGRGRSPPPQQQQQRRGDTDGRGPMRNIDRRLDEPYPRGGSGARIDRGSGGAAVVNPYDRGGRGREREWDEDALYGRKQQSDSRDAPLRNPEGRGSEGQRYGGERDKAPGGGRDSNDGDKLPRLPPPADDERGPHDGGRRGGDRAAYRGGEGPPPARLSGGRGEDDRSQRDRDGGDDRRGSGRDGAPRKGPADLQDDERRLRAEGRDGGERSGGGAERGGGRGDAGRGGYSPPRRTTRERDELDGGGSAAAAGGEARPRSYNNDRPLPPPPSGARGRRRDDADIDGGGGGYKEGPPARRPRLADEPLPRQARREGDGPSDRWGCRAVRALPMTGIRIGHIS